MCDDENNDDEYECRLKIPRQQPDVLTSNSERLPVLTLRKVTKQKKVAAKKVPASKTSKTAKNKQTANADASKTKKAMISPVKKRICVNRKKQCKGNLSHKIETVPKNKDEVESVEESEPRKKPKVTVAETATASSSGSISDSTEANFWNETLANKFNTTNYNLYLRNHQFSEQQANFLQKFFHDCCRKLSYQSYINSKPFIRTLKCQECEFSVSHRCKVIDYTQCMLYRAETTFKTNIVPELPTMCVCHQFSFLHTHAVRTHTEMGDDIQSKTTECMLQYDRSVGLSCSRCQINIHVNPQNNGCREFTNWKSVDGANLKQFYESVEKHMQHSTVKTASLEELYTCSRQCCLLFHRCDEDAL